MCQGAGKAGEAQKDRGKQQPVMHLGVCVCANELAIVTASECLKSNLRRRVDKFVCTNWYNKRQPAKRGNVRKDSRINTQMKMGKSALRKIFTFILVHFLLATHVHVSSYCWYCWQSISPACIPATLSNCSTYFFTHSFQFHFVTVKSLILSKFHTHTWICAHLLAFTFEFLNCIFMPFSAYGNFRWHCNCHWVSIVVTAKRHTTQWLLVEKIMNSLSYIYTNCQYNKYTYFYMFRLENGNVRYIFFDWGLGYIIN